MSNQAKFIIIYLLSTISLLIKSDRNAKNRISFINYLPYLIIMILSGTLMAQ